MVSFEVDLKTKKAHHLFIWQSGLILVSSFMEAPSIRHPFFVLRLSFWGLIVFILLMGYLLDSGTPYLMCLPCRRPLTFCRILLNVTGEICTAC